MKKKVIILIVIILALILLFPIPMRLKDGGSIEFRALLYSVTKYHRLDHESTTGYRDGIGIEILGMQVYERFDNSNNETGGQAPVVSKSKVYITIDNILNIDLLDNFMDNTNKYNKNPISDKVEIVSYTKEGDELLTTLEYNKEKNEFTLIHDNTKDEFASEENRKVTTDNYSRSNYDLVKEINDSDIYVKLKSNNNESEDVYICGYNKKLEKNKDTTRITLKEANLKSKDTSTTELISYNDIVYGRSYAIIDYATAEEPIAVINRLIGEEYMPILEGETNSEKLLNIAIVSASEKSLVVMEANGYSLFNAIETNTSSFFAKVIESNANYIIVEPVEGSNERKSADKISIGLGKTDMVYEVGTNLKITYNGSMKETYPAKVDAIKIEVKSSDNFELIFNARRDQKIKTIISKTEQNKYTYSIFSYGGDVEINIDGKVYDLRDALLNNKITMEEIIAKANNDLDNNIIKGDMFKDGGTMIYQYENHTIIKYNQIKGSTDVVIGIPEMSYGVAV